MKLYDVPRNTKIRVVGESIAPPAAREAQPDEELMFHHIDGMYSYCKDLTGKIVHLPAWQEVEII